MTAIQRETTDFTLPGSYGLGTTGFWSGANTGLAGCIREAVDQYGLHVLDTAEMYGNGRCESALGKVIRGIPRDKLFLVDKILPEHMNEKDFFSSLHGSLRRLGTDYLDLYLLHWRGEADLSFLAASMEAAVQKGLIRFWGVSNFDEPDLEDLLKVENGDRCYCNQIFYSLYERGSEYSLLPFMKSHGILPMSYSSLGSDYHPHPDIHKNKHIMELCRATGYAPESMMLKMNAAQGFCALFSTFSLLHLRENLRQVPEGVFQQFRTLADAAFPPPDHASPLVKI